LKLLDLFSGIGGFHLGLERAGFEFDWVGFSDIDKYANKQYKKRFPNAEELGDIRDVRSEDLPKDIDILCGGFPCQSFSIAGQRKGFDDTRGTLFFEIARILRYFKELGKPIPYFLLENVKGLLNHEDGRTFTTIHGVLTDLDYSVECQLLNTRWFLPQNRERIYIIGHLGKGSGPKVFPIGEVNEEVVSPPRETGVRITNSSPREYKQQEISPALLSRDYKDPKIVIIDKEGNEKGNQSHAACLSGGAHSGGNHSDMDLLKIADYRTDEGIRVRRDNNSPTLTASHNSIDEPSRMQGLVIKPVLTPDRPEKRQNGRRFKEDGEDMFTLTAQDRHGILVEKKIDIIGNLKGEGGHECHNVHSTDGIAPTVRQNHGKITMIGEKPNYGSKALNETLENANLGEDDVKALDLYNRKAQDHAPALTEPHHNNLRLYEKSSIRRLTPTECERLQGFPDGWTEGQSDTQRYKQLGNAVSVPVVKVIGEKLKEII